jgi:hypothetical protein
MPLHSTRCTWRVKCIGLTTMKQAFIAAAPALTFRPCFPNIPA